MYVMCSCNTGRVALSDVEFSSSFFIYVCNLPPLCKVGLVLHVGSKVNVLSSFVVIESGCRTFYLLTFLSFHITISELLSSPS